MSTDADQYAVFGQPVAHSRSPQIHLAFAAQCDQRISYRRIEAAPGTLQSALQAFVAEGGRGANITLPLKGEAASVCKTLGDSARLAGAVNTILLEQQTWRGENTDGIGLCRDLEERQGFKLRGARVMLLGAGGAARGVSAALLAAGVAHILVANRSPERAEALAGDFPRISSAPLTVEGLSAQAPCSLVINALSSGHQGEFPLPTRNALLASALAYDLSYGPAAQPFLRWAQASGAAQVSDGLGMLVEQAAESFYLWRGLRVETDSVLAMLR